MASESNVYLGYEDGIVTKKNRSSVTFETNKIGGKPVSKNNSNISIIIIANEIK